MPNHSIYALCEPDTGDVRYIGRTSYPLHHRLSNHVGSAKSNKCNPALSQWINDLLAKGQDPSIVLLEECSLTEADAAEKAWIALCAEKECNLLNKAFLSKRAPRTWTSERHTRKSGIDYPDPELNNDALLEWYARRWDLSVSDFVASARWVIAHDTTMAEAIRICSCNHTEAA